jgi:hypothetical protein
MSLLLLSVTTTMAIRVIPHGVVATNSHNSDIPISPTLLVESGAGLHKYLLPSSALRRWLLQIDLTNLWCVRG